ncbi:MAG: hypothetical protein MCS20_00720, partial [Candidatus Phytoplasma mali]|nr:hypothetical protein [Candidatus Phytoplasma mali]
MSVYMCTYIHIYIYIYIIVLYKGGSYSKKKIYIYIYIYIIVLYKRGNYSKYLFDDCFIIISSYVKRKKCFIFIFFIK